MRSDDQSGSVQVRIAKHAKVLLFEDLGIFVAVAEAGGFSVVARERGVAVSSVSRCIDGLEAELGARLFARSSRRLTLTEAGERFLPHARAMVADLAAAKDEVRALDDAPRGTLTVTAPAAFGRLHVMPAALRFMERHPQLEVELHLGDPLVDLGRRRLDVAIRMGALADSDLKATRLAPVHRLVCASPAYLERHGTPAAPADLLEHNCLTVASAPVPSGWWCFAGANGGKALPVRGTFRSDDTGALLRAALDGLGVVHLASWLVGEQVGAGRLRVLLPNAGPPPSATSAIYAVRVPERPAAKTRLFIAHLRDAFGAPPYWDAHDGLAALRP